MEIKKLNKYNYLGVCNKCGLDNSINPHLCDSCKRNLVIPHITSKFYPSSARRIEVNGAFVDITRDVMLRTCTQCGYQWLEKPLK